MLACASTAEWRVEWFAGSVISGSLRYSFTPAEVFAAGAVVVLMFDEGALRIIFSRSCTFLVRMLHVPVSSTIRLLRMETYDCRQNVSFFVAVA
jgi:hypothetical protein